MEDVRSRRSVPGLLPPVDFTPFLKRKSRLFIRGSKGFSRVFPQVVEQQATASAIWGGQEAKPCTPNIALPALLGPLPLKPQ
jgi:hypothetical protein